MMRATAKVPLTGITRLLSSSVGGVQIKQFNREKLSVVARSRGDRTFPAEVATAEAAEGKQLLPSGEEGIAPLVEVNEAVKRGERAAGAVQAAGARPQEGAVAPEVVAGADPVAAEEEAAVAAVAVAGDDNHWVKIINIVNHEFDGGEGDAY
jgi:hypothetical protein